MRDQQSAGAPSPRPRRVPSGGRRVLVITTVHVPLDARIHHRQIRALREAGWEVTYAAPWRATGTPPARAAEGVRTLEVPRAVGRRRLPALRAARRLVAAEGPAHDLVLLHDPELVLAVTDRLRRLPPVVLDVHEDLAASLADRDWVPDRARRPLAAAGRWLERTAERQLSLLLAEEAYAQRFTRPHPVVRNLPPLPPPPPPPGRDRVVHVGRLSRGRGVGELVALAAELADDGIHLELVGPADADVRDEVADAHARGLLTWHGWLPNDEAFARMAGALAGLCLLRDLPNFRVSLPTKVVEYLAAGLPVVATPLPAVEALLGDCDAGVLVGFGDVAGAAAAVRRLRDAPDEARRMGERGRARAEDGWCWESEKDRFLDALEAAAGGAAGSRAAPSPRRLPPLPDAPTVSAIVPVRDGAAVLPGAVASALQPEVLEVVVAVGPSADDTERVAEELARRDERVRVVANPSGRTPDALNAATQVAAGEVLVRVDAGSRLPDGYVAQAIRTLRETGAANVGGRQVPEAADGFARAVAAAMGSRAGAGGAVYRMGGDPGPVDTVYLGVFRREALEEVGGFDPRFVRNQDAECNLRLRRAGYMVWFDPALAVTYRPRGDVASLARQYHEYGRWRRRTAQVHRGSLAVRQLAAPALVVGLVGTAVLSAATRDPRPIAVAGGGYLAALAAAGTAAAPERSLAPATAAALGTMHLSWGVGFLQGPPRSVLEGERRWLTPTPARPRRGRARTS